MPQADTLAHSYNAREGMEAPQARTEADEAEMVSPSASQASAQTCALEPQTTEPLQTELTRRRKRARFQSFALRVLGAVSIATITLGAIALRRSKK